MNNDEGHGSLTQAGVGQMVHDGVDRGDGRPDRLPVVPVHQHLQQHQVRVHVLARQPCRVRATCSLQLQLLCICCDVARLDKTVCSLRFS